MNQIKVTKLSPNAQIPKRANASDAGADLYASESVSILPMSRRLVSTGIMIELPDTNIYARIAPRSGLAVKNGIDVLAGVVDNKYRGEIKVVLFNTDKENTFVIDIGDRIAQIIIENYHSLDFIESEIDTNTDRGVGGFGSTGVN